MKVFKFIHNPHKKIHMFHVADGFRLTKQRSCKGAELSDSNGSYIYTGSEEMESIIRRVNNFIIDCQMGNKTTKQKTFSDDFVKGWKMHLKLEKDVAEALAVREDKNKGVRDLYFKGADQKPWTPPNKKIKRWRNFDQVHIRAFDFECYSENHDPFMLSVNDFSNPTEALWFFEATRDNQGRRNNVIAREFLLEMKKSLNVYNQLFIYFSYNGAGYDNQFILDEYYANKGLYRPLKIAYGQGGGGKRSVLLEFSNPYTFSTAIFRDSMQYLPATDRASLAVVAKKLKSPWTKDETVTLAHINAAYHVPYMLRPTNPTWQLVKQYCIKDVAACFGVAQYFGLIFSSFPKVKEMMIDINPKIPQDIRHKFGIFFYGFTLSNITYAVSQFIDEVNPVTTQFPLTFLAFKDAYCVTMLRRAIYGGRTLAPSIGKVYTKKYFERYGLEIQAVDVSSMYPQATMAPLPGGTGIVRFTPLEVELDASFNPYDHKPFVCAVRFKKMPQLKHCVTEWGELVCHPFDAMPAVPYRTKALDFLNNKFIGKKKCGELRWIHHTNGEWFDGFYNCIHIYTMIQMGFQVEFIVNQDFPMIVWPEWTNMLCDTIKEVYANKYNMKKKWSGFLKEFEKHLVAHTNLSAEDFFKKLNSDPSSIPSEILELWKTKYDPQIDYYAGREKAYKIVLNGLIGKFAQKPGADIDSENPVDTDKVKIGKVLYQLNGFIMAYKDRIGLGMMSWVATGKSRDIQASINVTRTKGLVLYSDTDNCIFLRRNCNIEQLLKEDSLLADGQLGPFNKETVLFEFKLEPESYHKCPLTEEKGWHHELFFCMARKMYILQCGYCHQKRVKNKGHRGEHISKDTNERTGFITDWSSLLLDFDDVNIFLKDAQCVCKDCINEAFYALAYPELPSHIRPNSGTFGFLKKVLPNKEEISFGIINCTMSRTVSLNPAIFQRCCSICRFWIHK